MSQEFERPIGPTLSTVKSEIGSPLPQISPIQDKEIAKLTEKSKEDSYNVKKDIGDVIGIWAFWNLAVRQIVLQIKPEYPKGYDEETRRIMKDPNVVPFIFTTHRGLEDIITVAKLSKKNTKLINEARGVETSFPKIILGDIKEAFAGNLLKDTPEDKKPFKGFVLTIAKSVDTDEKGQSPIITELIRQLKKYWLPGYNLDTDTFVRDKDKTEFGMAKLNKDYDKRFRERTLSRDGPGNAMFPEGTMESGRTVAENEKIQPSDERTRRYRKILRTGKKALKIAALPIKEIVRSVFPKEATIEIEKFMQEPTNGMQEFDKSIKLDKILENMHKNGKKAAFFVAASENSFKIIDPNIKNHPMISWEAMLANFNPLNSLPVYLTLSTLYSALDLQIKGMMVVKVAMPILDEEMFKQIVDNRADPKLQDEKPTSSEINIFLGKRMAKMLPENLRGTYK